MARFELLRNVRELDFAPDDYRPKKWRTDHIEPDDTQHPIYYDDSQPPVEEDGIEYPIEGDNTERSGQNALHSEHDFPQPANSASADLGLAEEPVRRPLDEIAEALRTLTYGEMLELAHSMWKVNPQGSNITESGLPAVLYRWSTSRTSRIDE